MPSSRNCVYPDRSSPYLMVLKPFIWPPLMEYRPAPKLCWMSWAWTSGAVFKGIVRPSMVSPSVAPSAPGYLPKKLSNVRFSLTMKTTCSMGMSSGKGPRGLGLIAESGWPTEANGFSELPCSGSCVTRIPHTRRPAATVTAMKMGNPGRCGPCRPRMGGDLEPRPASASSVVLARQMETPDANVAGNVHGGSVMKMVDTAAGLAAVKHCGGLAVTAAMDEMTFLEPVYLGDVVTVKAQVNEAFTTSMEVGVRVEAEDVTTGRRGR